MSTIINRILNNLATRIMFIIYVFFILITGFFMTFNYYNELDLQRQRQYDKLKAIVSSMAITINGDAHEDMMNAYSDIHKPFTPEEDSVYNNIKLLLSESVRHNSLNSPMYTLVIDEAKREVRYGVRSDNFIDLNNPLCAATGHFN